MSEHHAFGLTGRPRCINNAGQIVDLRLLGQKNVFGRSHEPFFYSLNEPCRFCQLFCDNDFFNRRKVKPGLLDFFPFGLLVRHQNGCTAVLENESARGRGVNRVKRNRHERVGHGRLIETYGVHTVGQKHRDTVSPVQPQISKRSLPIFYFLAKLFVRD